MGDPHWFADALQKGLGRALAKTKETGKLADDNAVIDACVHNRAYDAEAEGPRTPWMVEILDAANAAPRLCEPILAHVGEGRRPQDLVQAAEVAEVFVRRGSKRARQVLEELLIDRVDLDCPGAAYEPVFRLEGLPGLLRVAADRGARVLAAPDNAHAFDDVIWRAERVLGTAPVRAALEKEANADPRVKVLLDFLYKPDTQRITPAQPPMSVDQFLVYLETRDFSYRARRFSAWGRSADDASLALVAQRLRTEQDAHQLERLISVFMRAPYIKRRPFLGAQQALLDLVHHDSELVSNAALRALAGYADPAVRALALERAHAGCADAGTVGLFWANYQTGDYRLLTTLMDGVDLEGVRASDEAWRAFYDLVHNLRDIFEKWPDATGREVMLFVYEQSPCALIRKGCVEIMLRLNLLPPNVMSECAYDANTDVRALVGASQPQ